MEELLLEMKGVTKRFGGVCALNNVSIDLRKGEILAIVGENGAGKSTLMKILSGSYSYPEYEGEIWVSGEQLRFSSPSDSAAAGIEMIYQEISMHLDMSVAENIFLGRLPKNKGMIDWNGMNKSAQTFLDMLGLTVHPGELMRALSTSQQQLVAIARALSRNPKILILDEPTSALTESEVERLMNNLEQLRSNGISCLYITHKMKEVMRIADRIAVLRDGFSVGVHKKEDITTDQLVEEMVNRKLGQMYPQRNVTLGKEVLRVEDLVVPHPYSHGKNIVDHVSFSVREREIVGLVGLVGAGRSETVNAIVGAIRAKGGTVCLKGKMLAMKNPRYAIKHGLVLLSEDRKKDGYIPDMTIAQNITLASLKKVSCFSFLNKKAEEKHARHYSGALRIKAQDVRDLITSLSGGNQQKVILAKWLMTQPDVLLLDEPTRGIDVGAKSQIYELMQELVEQGKSIVMISSEMPELIGMCDRFVVLAEGKIVAEVDRASADEALFLRLATGSNVGA